MSYTEDLIDATMDLIEDSGVLIALSASEGTRTASGGVARRPQVARNPVMRYFAPVAADARRLVTFEGEQLEVRHVLVGLPGDDIREKDTFSVGTRNFQVVETLELPYMVKGWVTERA